LKAARKNTLLIDGKQLEWYRFLIRSCELRGLIYFGNDEKETITRVHVSKMFFKKVVIMKFSLEGKLRVLLTTDLV
jgi:hypothetical protein